RTSRGRAARPRGGLAGTPRGPRALPHRPPVPLGGPLERADRRLPGCGRGVMSTAITLDAVTVNAPDALALAGFYAEITGGTARGDARFATVRTPGTERGFQQVDGFRAPSWPSGGPPVRVPPGFPASRLAGGAS